MKKTIKKRILEIISEKPLSTYNIIRYIGTNFSEDLWVEQDNLMSYISILKKEKKVIAVNNKKPYDYLAITPEALLKRLYSIMCNKMVKKKPFNEFEKKFTIKIIEENYTKD